MPETVEVPDFAGGEKSAVVLPLGPDAMGRPRESRGEGIGREDPYLLKDRGIAGSPAFGGPGDLARTLFF